MKKISLNKAEKIYKPLQGFEVSVNLQMIDFK